MMLVSIRKDDHGPRWLIRGEGWADISTVAEWPCSPSAIQEGAHPKSSNVFLETAILMTQFRTADQAWNQACNHMRQKR